MVHFVSCLTQEEFHAKDYGEDGAITAEATDSTRSSPIYDRRVAELYPAYVYPRTPVTAFGPDTEGLKGVLAIGGAHGALPGKGSPSVLTRLVDAHILNEAIYVGAGLEKDVIYETYRPNDRHIIPWVDDSQFVDPIRHPAPGPDGTELYFWLGSVGSSNYGHWLVDDLPRFKVVLSLLAENPSRNITVVMSTHGDRIDLVRSQTLRALVPGDLRDNIKQIFIRSTEVNFFPELYYASPCTFHPNSKSPDAMRWVQQAWRATHPYIGTPKRLFVSRSVTGRRDLQNFPEVAEYLAQRGFTMILTEDMDFAAQAQLFSSAEVIVGCMGASMTNMIFADSSARIGCLAPDGWIETFYWDLSLGLSQRYAACYGTSSELDRHPWDRNYTIDMQHLEQMLQNLGV